MSSLRSLCSGLLLLPARPSPSDTCRLRSACSAINHRLFIDLVHNTGSLFKVLSPIELRNRLHQLYGEAFAIAPHLDVRILLPPVPSASVLCTQLQHDAPHAMFCSHHLNYGYGSLISVYAKDQMNLGCVQPARGFFHVNSCKVRWRPWPKGRRRVQCGGAGSKGRGPTTAAASGVAFLYRVELSRL